MAAETLTRKKSVTIPLYLLAEAEDRTGARGLSAYVAKALATQLELDRLADYISVTEYANGPIPESVQEQFYADIAAADAEIGYQR